MLETPGKNRRGLGLAVVVVGLLACNLFSAPATSTPTISPPTDTATPIPTITPTHTAIPTPDRRVLNPENGHLYLAIDMMMGWHEAVTYCASRGGYLVTVQSDAENEFVNRLDPNTWLGATDEASEGLWVWANGEPWSYTQWYPGEPNDGDSDFLHYWGDTMGWDDLPDFGLSFVCEWDGAQESLSQDPILVSVSYHEENQTPPYTIDAQTPQLAGSDDPRVLEFNRQAGEIVQGEIDAFRGSMAQAPDPTITGGSSVEITYRLESPPGDLLSIKFFIFGYYDGAAHPYTYSVTLTYDLAAGRRLELAHLFLPGMDYLQVISDYCGIALTERGIGFDTFSEGANPLPENYARWNLTADGLLITFDAYQVAAYAAGPQEVLIPYAELIGIIDPAGPLAAYVP